MFSTAGEVQIAAEPPAAMHIVQVIAGLGHRRSWPDVLRHTPVPNDGRQRRYRRSDDGGATSP